VKLVLELRPPESRLYGSWGERLDTVARFSKPDEVHALCEKAWTLGARTVIAVLDDTIREALVAFQRWRPVAVWAVIPNMFAFIRDLTDLGMVGAARARFMRLTPAGMMRTGLGALSDLGGIKRKDFKTGAMLVADMELAALRDLRVARLFLHPQVTEVALAGGLTNVFEAINTRAAKVGVDAGIITHNPVRAANVLGSRIERFAAVITPCNAKGYKMFPSRAESEALLTMQPARFLALDPTAGGTIPLAKALAHVRALGLPGAVLDWRAVDAAFRDPTELSVAPRATASP
jgi:hypothetical protein